MRDFPLQESMRVGPNGEMIWSPILVNWFNELKSQTDSGIYTPDMTIVTNLDSVTSLPAQWCRVSSDPTIIFVSGRLMVNPTAAADTSLRISLPPDYPSDFALQSNLGGVAFCHAVQQGAALRASVAGDDAILQFLANDTTEQSMSYIFSYQVIG